MPLVLACLALLAAAPASAAPEFGAPAFYGRLNLTLEQGRVDGGETTEKLVDNGSRLGLRAGGELSDDTAIMLQLEARLKRLDSGDRVVRSRDSWIGLRNAKYGTVMLGMMEGPLFHATYDEISMHNHNSGNSEDKLLAEDATGGRMERSLYYRLPDQGPFKIELLHAFLKKDPATVNASHPRHDEFALTYQSGDSWIAGGYAESRNLKVDKAWTLAAATTVKGIVIAGLYERSAATPAAGGQTAQRDYARIAAKYPVGKQEFHVNVGIAGDKGNTPDSGAVQATLAYNYHLTDKTKLYAFATRIDNDRNGAYSFLDNTPAGADNRSLAVGFRHNF